MRGRATLRWLGLAGAACATLWIAPCSSPAPPSSPAGRELGVSTGESASASAWRVVYGVLQHPRCVNCHPAGDAPLQGEDGKPHAQNVQRGRDGHGLYALRCETCHQTQNLAGPHLPPGAPGWHLPHPDMPLVFEGRSSHDLCRALHDPAQNGGRTGEQLLEHVEHDPLVLWGWDPGEGRASVATPHAEFVRAVRSWVDGGCDCPEP